MTTYLLAGGGTAGHVNPLLATADRLRRRDPGATILVLGTAEGLEARLVPARGYELLTVPRLPFPRKPGLAALRFSARIVSSVSGVRKLLAKHRVDVVVGFGGYAAAPAYLAAWRARVPIVVHEANAKPGIANVLGSFVTKHVGVVFASTKLRHSRHVGMPLRDEIENLDRRSTRSEAQQFFGLDPAKPTVLVFGGSTGARRLNDTVSRATDVIIGAGWQILHISGEKSDLTSSLTDYHVVKYCDRMDLALAAADFVVSRAGSATVSELTALGLPAVLIPYPVGNGEQRFNAADVVAAGGAELIADEKFTPAWVRSKLVPLLLDRARIADMAARAASVGVRDGADKTVDLVLEAVAPTSSHESLRETS